MSDMICGFCGKNKTEVKQLIAGQDVYICDECIGVCSSLLGRHLADKSKNNTPTLMRDDITPSKIKEFLDQHIIGQESAKTLMAVAVTNHYKRISSNSDDGVELEKSNVIMVGPSGTGKCLAYDTPIEVKVDDTIGSILRTMSHSVVGDYLIVKIGDVFEAVALNENAAFNIDEEYNHSASIQMVGGDGEWYDVPSLIVKTDKKTIIKWSDGTVTKCAANHIIQVTPGRYIRAKHVAYGQEIVTDNGNVLICVQATHSDEIDNFYDLMIMSPDHTYIDANGIIHHNTLFGKTIAKLLDIPFVVADATTLTEAGFVGEDVESVITKLVKAAKYDIAKAQHGIIYIDEIDKKATKSVSGNARDISGEGVQQALLKLIEGSEVQVPPVGGKTSGASPITVNTKDILFIVGGAFVGIDKIIAKRKNSNHSKIGFCRTEELEDTHNHDVTHDDLISYGIIPELAGRLPIIATLDELSEQDLVNILSEPKNAITKQYQKIFMMDGVELVFTTDALRYVATEAKKKKMGARGLRSIIDHNLTKLQYELPELNKAGCIRVVIDRTVLEGGAAPKKMYNNA